MAIELSKRISSLVDPAERVWADPSFGGSIEVANAASVGQADVFVRHLLDTPQDLIDARSILIGYHIDRAVARKLGQLVGVHVPRLVLLSSCTLRGLRGGFEVIALAAGTSGRDLQAALPVPLFAGPALSEL